MTEITLTCYASGRTARMLDGEEVVLMSSVRRHDMKFRWADKVYYLSPYYLSKHDTEPVYIVGDGLTHMSIAQYGLTNQQRFTIKAKV